MDGNLTHLPITYSVLDESVAQILVTREDVLTGYWKFDESMYAGAKDETGSYNGTLVDLETTGSQTVWKQAYFRNG